MQLANFPGCLKALPVGLTKAKRWREIVSVLHWIFQFQCHSVLPEVLRQLIIILSGFQLTVESNFAIALVFLYFAL